MLEGTTRSFNQDIQNRFPDRIRRIVDDVASSFNAKAEVDYTIGSLSCINHPALSQIAKAGITKLYGEDFAYLIQTVPGIIVFLGGGNKAKNTTYPHHHEKFNIDEDALPVGTSLYAQFALDFLNKK